MSRATAVALLLLGMTAIPGWGFEPTTHGIPIPQGIAEPGGRTGFIANSRKEIEAIDLVTGDTLWNTQEAQSPLLVTDHRLIALAESGPSKVRMVLLDISQEGEKILESDEIIFPSWVKRETGAGHSFSATWSLKKGKLHLTWKARAWESGPVPLSPEKAAAHNKQAEGSASVDLTTGEVRQETLPNSSDTPPYLALKHLERVSVRWHGRFGDCLKAIALERSAGKEKLLLVIWSYATARVELSAPLMSASRLQVLITPDHRYACVRDCSFTPEKALYGEEEERKPWRIFSMETGKEVAQAPFEPGTQEIAYLPPRILFLKAGEVRGDIRKPFSHSRTLKGFDLITNKGSWETAVEGKGLSPR